MKITLAEKQVVIGLDLSLTSTGLSYYSIVEDTAKSIAITTSSKDSTMSRYRKILDTIKEIDHFLLPVSIYFIEGYSFGSFNKSSSMSNLIELGGIIKYDLSVRDRSYASVPPSVLKKFVTGKGNSKKEDIKLGIYKKYGQEFKTSDEADAFALAMFGCKFLGLSTRYYSNITEIERACFTKINIEGLT